MFTQYKKLCLHCDPYPNNSTHISEKLEILLSPVTVLFSPLERMLQKFPKFHATMNKILLGGFFKTLLTLKILKEVEAQDADEGLYNRTLVVVREAWKRGIKIKSLKFFGKATNHFSIETNGVKKYFEGLPHLVVENISLVDFDDKGKLKELLQKERLPHPQGSVFRNYSSALQYVKEVIGFPVVVKPRSGSLSKHTTCNIKTEHQLQEAVRIARVISKEFVVEEFIEGSVHRITVINGNVAASCLREPPNVIGDGKHTIQELINIKNQNPIRGMNHQKNFTLHKITISEKTNSLLGAQNLNLNSILSTGQKIYLHDKVILACGADIHDTTDEIHPENKTMFQKVYELCGAPLMGIDFITSDISKPHYEQKCAVIEVNSLPYIDMHHYPVTGKVRNVARHILDYYISLHKFS